MDASRRSSHPFRRAVGGNVPLFRHDHDRGRERDVDGDGPNMGTSSPSNRERDLIVGVAGIDGARRPNLPVHTERQL